MDFLDEELEEILNIFKEESEEHVQNINQNLLKLEKNPADFGVISELFRSAHSIKGAARMIGLNDIQNIAHKFEDIIGYAKDRTIKVTPEIIDILCKAVDCINSIIDESIKTKGACHSPIVDQIIKKFEEIEKKSLNGGINTNLLTQQEVTQVIPEMKISEKNPTEKEIIRSINELLPDVMEDLDSLNKSSDNKNFIASFSDKINKIDEILGSFDERKVKDSLFNVKSKLDWIKKGSGILTDIEMGEINENLLIFVNQIKNISSNLNIEKTIVENNLSQNPQDEILGRNIIKSLLFNIDQLTNKDNLENNCMEMLKTINSIATSINNEPAKQILLKIADIVSYVKEAKITVDKEILNVLKQSVNSLDLIIFSEKVDEDPELIEQRLSILRQMLELSESNSIDNYPSVSSTDLIINEETDQKDDQGFSSVESDAIKTLRVDTKKLDQLANQVGELIVAKIKTREHLTKIEALSRNIQEWHKNCNKTKQHFKYIDKKSIKEFDQKQINTSFVQQKNIYSIFDETSEKISEIDNKVTSLYKTVQEDDTRINLIINELEQMIKGVRVLPLATIFHMFPRMVRDISRDKGKQIELILSGSETNADKKIIEEIKSPLTHIIRNSIDHGIETPDERIKKEKSPTGKIFLSAYHLENSILIEIIDDGRGIDLEKIKNKVIQKGLLSKEELAAMTDNQIMNIIFWPGFSTGEVVTDISGRGIGLDVVHSKISQLGGKVNVKSRYGEGCKVSIQLPVTMATIKAFLVSVNEQIFAIPTNSIKTALSVKPQDIFYKEGQKTIIVNDKVIPVFKLSKILELPDNNIEVEKYIIIVIQIEDTQVGFIIDKLLEDHEILHKNLSPPLIRVRNIAGVTTLGSGDPCLILNVNDLIKSSFKNDTVSSLTVQKTTNNSEKKQYNILVVDDSITTRILEKNILKAAGYDVSVAVNGLDALTKLNSEKFDLIVSDIEMPEMTGLELLKRIKQNKKYKDLPVILVTSLVSEKDKMTGLEAGANAYITKGQFDQKELLSTIKKHLTA
ncbi:MAG: hybrid sensor histidine kinase/response regulator [Candidatus Gastranaerophilaceae bacterium]|jgi:two-component system chemotaxis sensor kinase CheA